MKTARDEIFRGATLIHGIIAMRLAEYNHTPGLSRVPDVTA
ncbi:hypothetical protein [Selenomonas sp. WCT3]